MDDTPPPTSPETPPPPTLPSRNVHIPPPPMTPSTNARLTVFPRAIGERAQVFTYPPKLGVHRRGSGASSSGGSSSSRHRGLGMIPRESPPSLASPSTFSPSMASTSMVSSSSTSTSLATSTRHITRSFLVIPEGTHWMNNGTPSITHWPSEPHSVVLTLPDSMRWAGVKYPHHFPKDSVEFCVAEAFARLPQYKDTGGNVVTGSFFKRTKKRKGVGLDRAYKLEPYVQEAGAVYGKMNANTIVVYVPASSTSTVQDPLFETPPTQMPPFERPPIESPLRRLPELETPPFQLPTSHHYPSRLLSFETRPPHMPSSEMCPSELLPSELPSSSSVVIDLTLRTSQSYGFADENYLDFLSDEWIRLEEAYFTALERKSKKMCDSTIQDIEDIQRSTSFWKSFSELETKIFQDGTCTVKDIILGLVHRRNLRRGINCSDADLNKVTSHDSMQMFTPADLKLEFEKNARLFWREWDDFEYLIEEAPKDATYLDAAHILLHSHGEEGVERLCELEELFQLCTNKKLSLKLLELMCKSNVAPKDVEEEELLHRREEVEMALLEFQRCFLEQKVFYSYMKFSDTSRSVPTTYIKVIQGREYQAFCDQWREISLTKNACYKLKVEFVHSSGIQEKNTLDEDGLRNSWLTNCWKQFISMPFVYNCILEYTSNKEGAILHPIKDMDIVRPDIQLDTGHMIGHLIWEIASKNLEVNRPFTYSTLLMICDQVPESKDLTWGVDVQLRSNLERDFRLCFPSKWSILHQLRQSFSHATMLVSQLAEDEINEDLGWSFMNFQFEEENWIEQVEKKLGSIIWSHLFKDRELVGKALREGFFLAIETAPISSSMKEKYRSEVMQLTPECLKIAFSGSCCIEPELFMKSVKFENTISEDQQNWFSRAVQEMTHSERMRLVVFITRLEFFGGSQIKVALLNRDDDPCI